ncbi:MAG: CapA family protein [Dysgonamonadaceae bacterium]|jgi:poly-gamma-glutamate synthesis protein (capsule biosynthesis protein)|nr:CapA family protein [Dysgonamonadaceae bacterium]
MKQYVNLFLISLLACYGINGAEAEELTLLFAGDAMQHQSQIDNAFRNDRYDYSSYFQHITYEITHADIAVVNLETTLGGKPYKGYPLFSAPDEYACALKDAGFDVFLTANNHILDRFSKGLHRTLDVLDSLSIKHTGVFRNAAERKEIYPLIIEKKNIRIAFLNYTYATNGINPTFPDYVNYIDVIQIQKDIQRAKELKADFIIANMHWGEEYKLSQNTMQEKMAELLINKGVNIVTGSHPHVVQPSLAITDSAGVISNLIIYSLGNFVSAMTAPNTDGGQMIKIVLDKEDDVPIISSCGYMLIYTEKKKSGNKIDFSVVPVLWAESSGKIPLFHTPFVRLDSINYLKMRKFADNARTVFNTGNKGIAEFRLIAPKRREDFLTKKLPVKFVE